MPTTTWNKTSEIRPKRDQSVVWLDPEGNEVNGTFVGGAVWLLPEGVYVYYTPKMWKPAN